MRVDKKSKRRRYIWDNSFDSTTFSWRNCKSIEIKKMGRKNNYVMRRLDTPKKVTLPNCRTFYIQIARVLRSQLPGNIVMKRKYKRKAAPKGRRRRQVRKGQKCQSFFSSLDQ